MTKLLLIDDDDAFRKMLRLTLVKLGYQVTEAGNGKEALKRHAEDPADIIITDLIMPEKEGLETIQDFRAKHPGVKIIAISGGGRINARDFLVVAKVFGADRTFTKPFANADLAKALSELALVAP
jgi:CheY-like chemotaxis protein